MIIQRFLCNRPAIVLGSLLSSLVILSLLISEGFAQDTNTFSNDNSSASNATGTIITKANKVLNLASSAGANATQTAMDQARDIMTSITNNVSSIASNASGAVMAEANNLINAASNASNNATDVTGTLTQSEHVVPTAPTQNANSTGSTMTNYSSNHYQINFQYPTNWDLTEKTSRFDEGSDISVSGFSPSGVITIQYLNTSLIQGMDLQSAVYEFFKTSIDSDYKQEFKVIEQPSFVSLDKQKAGSYLYTHKDKYEDFATKWATQVWVIFVGNHGYLLSFTAPTNVFDAPEVKSIRDKFIDSIKFMGNSQQLTTNIPNRFD